MEDRYIVTAEEIEAMPGLDKVHFLNPNARRNNKSLGDLTGLTGIGFHIIDVPPGCETSEPHVHFHEDECVYVLAGEGMALIGDERFPIRAGDFIGYRKSGLPHSISNVGPSPLRCIVAGQRSAHDVLDYPELKKRVYRNAGMPWNIVDHDAIEEPAAGTGTK